MKRLMLGLVLGLVLGGIGQTIAEYDWQQGWRDQQLRNIENQLRRQNEMLENQPSPYIKPC